MAPAPPSSTAGEPNVLVAYASGHGSTQGVAERIAARLDATALVDVRPVEQVDDLDPFEAVILGSGVYGQRWIPSATEFVRRNPDALAARNVWLFSVGSFGDTHRVIGRMMKREPKEIGEIHVAIHPREYRVFAGTIQRHQWPLPSRIFFHGFGGRFGDNRNWPQIDAWADSIARSLIRAQPKQRAEPATEWRISDEYRGASGAGLTKLPQSPGEGSTRFAARSTLRPRRPGSAGRLVCVAEGSGNPGVVRMGDSVLHASIVSEPSGPSGVRG